MSETSEHEGIIGERSISDVSKNQSLQSKMNTFLTIAVMVFVGAGFLFMYYSNINAAHKRLEDEKKKTYDQQMQSDTALPKLGAVPFPTFENPAQPANTEPVSVGDLLGPPPAIPDMTGINTGMNSPNAGPPPKTPEELAEERRLNSPVFTQAATPVPATAGTQQPGETPGNTTVTANNTALGDALQPTKTVAARAQLLPSTTYLIPKGAKGDCTLETAISSQLPGLVTCVLAFDIYGANGKVVMLERGTTLTGETRSAVQQGQNRLFVLWSEARTPTGVTAQLDSPATDALGRSGVTGELDTHFWDRFGAAILISVVNGVIQAGSSYASSAGSNGGTSFNYNTQGTNSVLTEILKNTVNIPPTINIAQGERLQILFARDVDFRPVYALSDRFALLP